MRALQSLWFIFALMIFFHHVSDETGIGMFSAGGSCVVSFFIILSGFILAMVYGDKWLPCRIIGLKNRYRQSSGRSLFVKRYEAKRI